MRILLAADGTRGDVQPMIGLGVTLQEAGHEVLLCAPPDFADAAEEQGLDVRSVGEPIRDYLTSHAAEMTAGGVEMLRAGQRYIRDHVGEQFDAIAEAAEGADLILAAGIQLAAGSIAELRGVPYRYVIFCPAVLPSMEHSPALFPFPSLPRWANRPAWWLAQIVNDRLIRTPLNAERRRRGLAPLTRIYRYLLSERPLLATDAELAPAPRDCPVPVQQLRCLQPTRGPALPPKLASFLDEGTPPVYFGFGSMPDPDPVATTREILGAVQALGCRAVVSEGWAGLGDGALPGGVFVTGPVSHPRLFARCAAVVHHGGAGTTTTAARAGVPQLVVPHVVDQFYWGRRVSELGLGAPALPRQRFAAAPLAERLGAILENEIVAERACDLGERLRASTAAPLDVASILA